MSVVRILAQDSKDSISKNLENTECNLMALQLKQKNLKLLICVQNYRFFSIKTLAKTVKKKGQWVQDCLDLKRREKAQVPSTSEYYWLPCIDGNAYCPQLPLNSQEKIALQVKGHLTKFLGDTGQHILLLVSSFLVSFPWSHKSLTSVGFDNLPHGFLYLNLLTFLWDL